MASFGFFGLAGVTLVGGSDVAMDAVQQIGALAPAPLKATVAFVLSYQWVGSVRHAYWDLTAKGFTNAHMLHSSYAIAGECCPPRPLLSLSLALLGLAPPPRS